jgi:predicted Zn-dependent peptidase
MIARSTLGRALLPPLALVVSLVSGSARADDVSIPNVTSKLSNGMTVILHEDHTLPVVAVNIAFRVGSRFEESKRTGFAHLFEHLMFMGTRRAPTKAFDAWMEAAGGYNNADTSEDHTEFYDVGPPTSLPLLLWLEADRLRDLGPMMTQEKLDTQREVVRNERRQTSENQPYGKVELLLPELLFPEGHPYHHPVIGSHEDLEAATVDDVKAFFQKWYDPADASLVVAGDFDPAALLPILERDFGTIASHGPTREPALPPGVTTNLATVVRKTVTDRVELPKIVLAWQSPRHFAPGDAELDLVASVLASGKASRLYKSLVYEKKIAQSVEAEQSSGDLASRFVVGVVARPGVSLDKLEAAILAEVALVRVQPVTDEELARAQNGVAAGFVSRLETVRGRASLLNAYELDVGDPSYAQKDLDRYTHSTKSGLLEVAAKVLDPAACVLLRVVPESATQGAP